MTDTEIAVRDFIAKEIMFRADPSSLDVSYSLLEAGAIDSMDLFKLVTFLEERFGIQVDDEALVGDNFESVQAIGQMIEKLRNKS